ncbi:MAG: ABC transporter permease [Nitrospiraceae bacterium]|nr:ABC transporter permease [Nitrospiraceae bacterium]
MKLIRIKAIAQKEILQIRRDPLSLAMAFIMPVLLLLIFGYAITLDVNNLTTIVYDADQSSLSRELLRELTASGYFTIVRNAASQREIDGYLDAGKARVAVSIPVDFAKTIGSGTTAQLQVIVDGSDSNTATIALGYLSALTELFSQRTGGSPTRPLIDPRIRVWYNPDLKSRNFIIPGLIAVIMMVIAALLTSLTFVRELERGTMEQLISTPVKTEELVLGKLVPYFLIGFIDMIMAVVMAIFLFEVPFKGNVLILGVVTSVFLFGALGLGIVISIAAKSQLEASQIAMVATFLPAFLLSGFMFAISNMPAPLQFISRIVPARYFIVVLKGIFLKGNRLAILMGDAIFLLVFAVIIFVVANRKFKKKIV